MALVYFLIWVGFCFTSWWVIRWFLRRYFSSKPWHRWVRYAVWLGCIVLLTFDSIYYQVVVVHGMCEADKNRVYPAPPASLVVSGPYSKDELRNKLESDAYTPWICKKVDTNNTGYCILEGLKRNKFVEKFPFGGSAEVLEIRDSINQTLYYKSVSYNQSGQWLTRKIFGFGFIWQEQPKSCEIVRSNEQMIYLD